MTTVVNSVIKKVIKNNNELFVLFTNTLSVLLIQFSRGYNEKVSGYSTSPVKERSRCFCVCSSYCMWLLSLLYEDFQIGHCVKNTLSVSTMRNICNELIPFKTAIRALSEFLRRDWNRTDGDFELGRTKLSNSNREFPVKHERFRRRGRANDRIYRIYDYTVLTDLDEILVLRRTSRGDVRLWRMCVWAWN